MSESSTPSLVEENTLGDRAPLITPRALLLGALTIAATFYYFTLVSPKSGGRGAVAQYPLSAFLPFVFWIFANVVLKLTVPRLALKQGELLTLFVMTWVVAVIPGWMSSWVATLTGATHFATAENSWAEIFFNFVPWHAFPPATQRITDNFWYGLPQGMAVPWDGWIGPLIDWLGVSLAVVVFGYCLLVIFQHQWENNEKLTYPLAQLPVDLTDGFDGKRRFPDIFYKRLFWIGFGVLFLPQLYNIFTYFSPGLPSADLFWTYYIFHFDDARITSFIRVTPLMLMVIYLCPVDILGSMLLFHVVNQAKSIAMRRFGTPSLGFTGVNANNRFSEGQMILHTESHGAMVFFFLWSLWVARRHLKRVWGQVRTGKGDPTTVGRYRMAMAGMIVSALYVLVWALRLGVSLPMALGVIGFMALSYLVTVKLVAASGVAYLYPNRPYVKGESFFLELVGFDLHFAATSGSVQGAHQFRLLWFDQHPCLARHHPSLAHLLAAAATPLGIGDDCGSVSRRFRPGRLDLDRIELRRGRHPVCGRPNRGLLRRHSLHPHQSHPTESGALGDLVHWHGGSGGDYIAAGAVSLVSDPSNRADLPADPRHVVAVDQLPHRLVVEADPVALWRREGVFGGQTLLLRAWGRVCNGSDSFEHRRSNMVSELASPGSRLVT